MYLVFLYHSCVKANRCDDNRNKNNVNKLDSEDILNSLISSAQNAKCDEGSVCCSKTHTKDLSEEDYYNYNYEDELEEPEQCKKFSLDGEIAGTYSKVIQAEKFNYR